MRSYLLVSLKNFLAKAKRREMTVKRGEGRALVPLDELLARERADLEPADKLSADRIYQRRWALTLLEQVFTRLESEYQSAGNAKLFDRLKEFLSDEPGRPSQADVAAELGMTENAVKQAFHRLRQRYRQFCEKRSPRRWRFPETWKTSCAISFRCSKRNLWENFEQYKQGAARSRQNNKVQRVCAKCGVKIFAIRPADFAAYVCLKQALARLMADRRDAAVDTKEMEFGDYELLKEIGRGGQAVVYRARQKSLNRTVALKIIGLGQWASTPFEAFPSRSGSGGEPGAPNIVPIYEVGERDGGCYFSMKFVEGGQLDEVARREANVDPARGGTDRKSGAHRSLRPRTPHTASGHQAGKHSAGCKRRAASDGLWAGALVETESSVTRTMEVSGHAQLHGARTGRGKQRGRHSATDVYGLGAVFYQLLTGQPPFAGGTTYETIKLLLDTEPRQPRLLNPKVDRDLATICLKCLEKDPQRRYSSALALAEDLERWLKHEPIRARRTGLFTRGRKWVRRNPSIAVMAAMLLVLAVPLGVMIWKNESERSAASNAAPPEKSIAVLPFSNLSKEQENAFFTDGVQDEILTNLAKVADLKVISRTTVMPYKSGNPRNLRQIGQQLGVAHVVEGSVQRTGNRVRVNAQLVDARTDRHLWAQTYDRELADVFAIQSEIAKTIAEQLQAKLSPSEKNAIERPPTTDISAFDLYAHAKVVLQRSLPGQQNTSRQSIC